MRCILFSCLVLFFVGCSQNAVPQSSSLARAPACVDKNGEYHETANNKGCAIYSGRDYGWDCGSAPKAGETKWGTQVGNFWELSCTGIRPLVFQCPLPNFWKKIGDKDWGCVAS